MELKKQVEEAAAWIRSQEGRAFDLAIILGTGLGALADEFGAADSAVPRSTTSTTETFNGSNLNVGNVPGTGTNGGTGGGG